MNILQTNQVVESQLAGKLQAYSYGYSTHYRYCTWYLYLYL